MAVIDWWNGPLTLVVILFALCLLLLTGSIAGAACRACHSSGTFFHCDTHTHTHWVGSVIFSRQKIGHAHDNSADSENVAGAHRPECACAFHFRFENGQGNNSFFISMPKTQLKRVNHKLSRRTIDVPSNMAIPRGLRWPWEKFGSARLSCRKKKAYFVDRTLLVRGYKLTKHDRFGKRPAATEPEDIDNRSTEAEVNALRMLIALFFFFFQRSSNNLDLRFLLWK